MLARSLGVVALLMAFTPTDAQTAMRSSDGVQLVSLPPPCAAPATRPASIVPATTAAPLPGLAASGLVLFGALALRRIWNQRKRH